MDIHTTPTTQSHMTTILPKLSCKQFFKEEGITYFYYATAFKTRSYFDRKQFRANRCALRLDELGDDRLPFAQPLPGQPGKQPLYIYMAMTAAQVLKYYERVVPEEQGLQSIVLTAKPVALFIDIDAKPKENETPAQAKIRQAALARGARDVIMQQVEKLFVDFSRVNFGFKTNAECIDSLKRCFWFDSSTGKKLSLHFHASGLAFENLDHIKRFIQAWQKFLEEQYAIEPHMLCEFDAKNNIWCHLIDGSIYTTFRNFRMINQRKPGENPLVYYSGPMPINPSTAEIQTDVDVTAVPTLSELVLASMPSYSIDPEAEIRSYTPAKAANKRKINERNEVLTAVVETARQQRKIVKAVRGQSKEPKFNYKVNQTFVETVLKMLPAARRGDVKVIRSFKDFGCDEQTMREWAGEENKEAFQKAWYNDTQLTMVRELVEQYAGDDFAVGEPITKGVDEQFIQFQLKRMHSSDCKICERDHDTDNQWCGFSPATGKLFARCYRDTEQHISLSLGCVPPDTARYDIQEIRELLRTDIGEVRYKLFCKTCFLYENETEFNMFRKDVGNALVVREHFKDTMKFSGHSAAFPAYIWNEATATWTPSTKADVQHAFASVLEAEANTILQRLMEQMAEVPYLVAQKKTGKDSATELAIQVDPMIQAKDDQMIEWKAKLQQSQFLEGIYKQVVVQLYHKEFQSTLNCVNPNWIPVKHGKVLDCKTLILRDRTKEDRFTHFFPVEFVRQKNKYRNALKFFKSITCNDPTLTAFMLLMLGYFFMGHTNLKHFFIFIGQKNSGKSTVMSLLYAMMGIFAGPLQESVLMVRSAGNANAHSQHLFALMYKRLCMLSELDPNQRLSCKWLKTLTAGVADGEAGEPIQIRGCGSQDLVDFTPSCSLVVSTNQPVAVDNSTDTALLEERMVTVPFNAKFIQCAAGDRYKQELFTQHLDELFSCIIEGGAHLFANDGKFEIPAVCRKKQDEYRADSCSVKKWMQENCILNKDAMQPPGDLYPHYENWAVAQGLKYIVSKGDFLDKHIKPNYPQKQRTYKGKSQTWVRVGIALKTTEQIEKEAKDAAAAADAAEAKAEAEEKARAQTESKTETDMEDDAPEDEETDAQVDEDQKEEEEEEETQDDEEQLEDNSYTALIAATSTATTTTEYYDDDDMKE